MAFAPKDDVEAEVLAWLRQRCGHVSNERLLSGPGLANFARALAARQHVDFPINGPADVVSRANLEHCPICKDAIERFCHLLGAAAGDLALTYGARGGVYLTGGMIAHLGGHFDSQLAYAAFIDKGRFADYLKAIPLIRALRTDTGLIGAAAAAMQMM